MTARGKEDGDRERALAKLRKRAAACRNCDLWKSATQTVFGAGPATAPVMFVGEQPGDVEDVEGEPFVGPAGRLLRQAIVEAGGDPAGMYLTNAVKHFKWEPRGKRRIHERPNREEILACRMWLDEEVGLTTFQLIGLFKRTVGLTPHAYLTQVRLGMACRQLRRSPVLAEVATAVGFYDQSALNKHFKRCYGITPLQFARAAAA